MHHAMDGEGAGEGMLELLSEVEGAGCTAVFEWVGPQVRMKVNEQEERLVLLQVRNKVTGEYVPREEVER